MPELPEVETMRRGIAAVAGSRIKALRVSRSRQVKPIRLEPGATRFRRRVKDASIRAVERLGKRVILALETDDRIVFEPRMTGLVLLGDPPTRKHLRARLLLEGGSIPELVFWDRRGLSTLTLLSPEELAERLGPERLGPDALCLEPGVLEERLGASRRPIKVALLDQRAVAGIGNIYAAEILNVSRILPTRPCAQLHQPEWRSLERAVRKVLAEAIRYEGSTLNDGTYTTALSRRGSYQNRHRVYGREGQSCPRCMEPIVRVVLGQRATFFCPGCQR